MKLNLQSRVVVYEYIHLCTYTIIDLFIILNAPVLSSNSMTSSINFLSISLYFCHYFNAEKISWSDKLTLYAYLDAKKKNYMTSPCDLFIDLFWWPFEWPFEWPLRLDGPIEHRWKEYPYWDTSPAFFWHTQKTRTISAHSGAKSQSFGREHRRWPKSN